MESNESLTPPKLQPDLTSSCEISDLSDDDLGEIFKYLLPHELLLIGEVCKRWHRVSGLDELEIFDLSLVPGPYIAGIIEHSPNVQSVVAMRKRFNLGELHVLSRVSLSSLKLYSCAFDFPHSISLPTDSFSTIFSGNLQNALWEELILHDLNAKLEVADVWASKIEFAASLPKSLKRLQISGVTFSNSPTIWSDSCFDFDSLLRGIGQLSALECLMLHSSAGDDVIGRALSVANRIKEIASLPNLRELYLSNPAETDLWQNLIRLPKLEVLFLHCASIDNDDDEFVRFTTRHPSLRILVFTGYSLHRHEGPVVDFPARVRHVTGQASTPLPQLHIFVGVYASLKFRFPEFASDAARVYPISEALPRFLAREHIKQIFQGVWIAEKIKEAARCGAILADYAHDVTDYLRFRQGRALRRT